MEGVSYRAPHGNHHFMFTLVLTKMGTSIFNLGMNRAQLWGFGFVTTPWPTELERIRAPKYIKSKECFNYYHQHPLFIFQILAPVLLPQAARSFEATSHIVIYKHRAHVSRVFISNHESAQNRCTVLKLLLKITKIKETENPLEEFESVIYKPIHVAMFGKRLQKTIMII